MTTVNKMMGRRYDGGQSPLTMGKLTEIEWSPDNLVEVLSAKPTDRFVTPDCKTFTVKRGNEILQQELGMTLEEYTALPLAKKKIAIRKLERALKRIRGEAKAISDYRDQQAGTERNELHNKLYNGWRNGPLALEKPQASSLHHLVNYNNSQGNEDDSSFLTDLDDTQNIIVEHEWARALPVTTRGEWRLPFEKCCWEFRISGVRVLAFTFAADVENPEMVMVYGAERIWVADDYIYHLGGDQLVGKRNTALQTTSTDSWREFRRVAEIVYANIRAACIMLEAPNVCERQAREPSDVLVTRAKREGSAAPRRHQVIRLMNMERRVHHYRMRTGGGKSGVKQGGHWRRGTWVHYDDQDSGQVQYVNDGGFMVSKTWRGWHFAGDPENMVDKEYRL